MLRRIWPLVPRQSPLDVFSLLLVGHGFTKQEFPSIARRAWARVTDLPPLNRLEGGFTESFAVSAVFEDGDGPELGISQSGGQLNLGGGADQRLRDYLATRTISAVGETVSAADAWPLFGSGGRSGSLVAVLCGGTQPAELYQLTPTAALRTPLVAVVPAGDHWELPIARALCQLLAGLADEYELPGAEFERAPGELADWSPPNVLIVTGEQRDKLAAGTSPDEVIPHLNDRLPVGLFETVSFHPHQGMEPNPPAPRVAGGVSLVEGGSGFRFNALRTDFDCLMRRRPVDPALPVQADVWLCKTCRNAVDRALSSASHLPRTRRVLLHNQRPLFDEVRWAKTEIIRTFPFRRTVTHGPPDPIWSCEVEVTPQDGLTFKQLKLANRPDDPFSAATDVMSLIEFKDLEIELTDDRKESLPAANAFPAQRGLAAPTLEIAIDGGPHKEFRVGVKLTSWFLVADTIAVEVTYSLVLKHMANDIDPGGAALACKLYPQLALRHQRAPVPPDPAPAEIPKVTALKGTVSVWCNNTVPASMHDAIMAIDEHAAHMATGRNAATLLTDSNNGPFDAVYEGVPQPENIVRPGGTLRLVQSGARWKSGRKLAGVELSTDPDTLAATLMVAFQRGFLPVPLPHWSWLFDYGTPSVGGTGVYTGAYALHETTEGGSPASEVRDSGPLGTPWPPPGTQSVQREYRLSVRKLPRQGAYDNVHVALNMGTDDLGRQVISAPFCADKCLHIHWRWGTIASLGANVPYVFHGWGDGRLDAGAHSVPGAPLIPPNQHLDVRLSKETDGLAGVDYEVTAFAPGAGHAQVFLEQGISFAFGYSGLGLHNVGALATALDLQPFLPTSLGVRRLFHRIYPVLRWFGEGEDVIGNTVQQIPGPPSVTFLEKL